MQSFNIVKNNSVKETFNYNACKGMFDLKDEQANEHFKGEIKLLESWQIGIIVGNSGTGKSTIAKEVFKDNYINNFDIDNSKCILDLFNPKLSLKEIVSNLGTCGFSSPPCFLKPYNVLSNGEKMRVDLALLLSSNNSLCLFDEFTSVVDRNVAKTTSIAIAKAVRKTNKQFVAVCCHFDVVDYLEPDWVFNTNTMQTTYPKKKDQSSSLKSTNANETNLIYLKSITI